MANQKELFCVLGSAPKQGVHTPFSHCSAESNQCRRLKNRSYLKSRKRNFPKSLNSLPNIRENINKGLLEYWLCIEVVNVGCKPLGANTSFSLSPGSAPPRDGLWPPKPTAKSRMSAAAGVPGAWEPFVSGPFVLVKTFTPWYKCRRRPDRCRQFLRGTLTRAGRHRFGPVDQGRRYLVVLVRLGLFGSLWGPMGVDGCQAEVI